MSELQLFAPNAMRAVEHRGWGVRPLKFLFRRGKELGEGSETLLSVYRDHGVVPKDSRDDNHNRASDDLTKYQVVRRGDLVVNKMKAWQGSVAVSSLDGIVSPAYFVYRPLAGIENRYAHYLLRTRDYFRFYAAISAGVRPGQWDLDPVAFDRMPVLLPSLREQRQIADYLDHETAEIDAFIADMAKMRSLTRERMMSEWAALFTQAMSGPLTQVRHVVDSLVDGPFGSGLTSAHYVDEGAPVVRLGNVGRYRFEIEPRVYISRDYAAELGAHAVRPGDVVIAGLGDINHPLGRAAVVPLEFGEGIVKADCYRARVNRSASAEFLAWSLSAPQTSDSFREMSRGSTRARLNLSVVAATSIPVPERETQDRLVASYEAADATATSALQEIDAAIALAKERRAALITAAVTGQVDVTAKQLPVADSVQTAIEEAQ